MLGIQSLSVNTSFWDLFKPYPLISTDGHLIDGLFNYTTWMAFFYFVLVCAGLFGFSYLYSAKRHKTPYYTYGNKKIHIMITTIIGAAVFLTIDLNISRISNNDLRGTFWNYPDPAKEKVLTIEVMAQQWMWSFRYAGPDGVFNTPDDVVTNNDLRVPVNTKVLFNLTSKDVIHSFFVPAVRVKVDTIPGRITRIWWDANTPGEYDIACAEMCGTHHYLMKAKLTVHTQEDFDVWMKTSEKIAQNAYDPDNKDMAWGWKWQN